MGIVGAKGRLPPNVPFWHTDYSGSKQLEKQLMQEGYSDLPLSPSPPKLGNTSPM